MKKGQYRGKTDTFGIFYETECEYEGRENMQQQGYDGATEQRAKKSSTETGRFSDMGQIDDIFQKYETERAVRREQEDILSFQIGTDGSVER